MKNWVQGSVHCGFAERCYYYLMTTKLVLEWRVYRLPCSDTEGHIQKYALSSIKTRAL